MCMRKCSGRIYYGSQVKNCAYMNCTKTSLEGGTDFNKKFREHSEMLAHEI